MSELNDDLGKLPALDWVDVNLIDVDHNYQREIRQRLVTKILNGFRWDHFGAVVLAPQENGRFHVTDGQHRVKAAKLHPAVERVPALITSGTGMVSEAENFLTINRDRQTVTPIERYWAGLTAGNPECELTAKILAAAGCDIVPEAGAPAINHTSAVSALQRAIRRYGDNAVRDALIAIRETWPGDEHALRGTLISAVSRIHRANGHLDKDRLRGCMRLQNFAELTAHAEGFRKLSGGSAETALAKTLTELYNRGLSKNIIYFAVSA